MDMAAPMSVDKLEPTKDDSGDESLDSSPHNEVPANNSKAAATATQENQQPKRKGGRKPIYATSEERKQRNRQAQAAFRERRTEYIKQLEDAIRTHEQNLASLQAAHRQAADECLMLRYKNSLLERILLEKGIDVKAELRAKTGSPTLTSAHAAPDLVQPPIQRTLMNRHHGRRSNSNMAPKPEPGSNFSTLPSPMNPSSSVTSPLSRPTPSSHSTSPTQTSFMSQQPASPTGSDPTRQAMHPSSGTKPHHNPQVNHLPGMAAQGRMHMQGGMPPGMAQARGAVGMGGVMIHPSYQAHMEHLGKLTHSFAPSSPPAVELCRPSVHSVRTGHEYHAADNMIDEDENHHHDASSRRGRYSGSGASYGGAQGQPMSLSPPNMPVPSPTQHQQQQMEGQPQMHGYPSMSQLLDAPYDHDPFGLNASMAFPQFPYDATNAR